MLGVKYIKDIFIPVLRIDNESGLNLRNYRSQSLVSKEWRILATESITIIDIDKLKKTSKYRKLSLLAKILSDDILSSFVNLDKLVIYLPDIDSNWLDLYDLIENKNHNTYDNLSKDTFTDYIYEGINKIATSAKNLRENENWSSLISKSISIVSSFCWYLSIHKTINLLQYNDPILTKEYIENKFNENLINIKYLKTLIITSGSLNIGNLLEKLPNLKHLTLSDHYPTPIDIDVRDIHKLETFRLLRSFQQKDRNIFSKLTNLRNLTIITEKLDQMINAKTIFDIIKLEHLENLEISLMHLPMINKVTKLKRLGLINCLVTNDDLLELSNMKNIKNIDFIENIEHPFYSDWTDHIRYLTGHNSYKEFMINHKRHNEKDIENFLLLRPDVKINYRNDIINTSDNDYLHNKQLYYML